MSERREHKHSLVPAYDDGIVCFGPLTESELERHKRLPRRTILPSNFKLSTSILDTNEGEDNVTQSTNNLFKEEETTGSIELKPSFSENSHSVFTSPHVTDLFTEKLIDTEVIKRHIRMRSTSPNETIFGNSEIDQDTSTLDVTQSTNNPFEEEETTGSIELKPSFSENSHSVFTSPHVTDLFTEKLIDTEVIKRHIRMRSISPNATIFGNSEIDQNKSTLDDIEMSSCDQLSASSVIEQSISDGQINTPNVDDNICILKHCSQQEDNDLSICSDSEFEDDYDGSIIAEKYSVTPGKMRLFDSRLAKPSFRAKTLVAPAPVMDRIEETTTPVMSKGQNSSIFYNGGPSETEICSTGLNETVIDTSNITEYKIDTDNSMESMFNNTTEPMPDDINNISSGTEYKVNSEKSVNISSATTVLENDEDKSVSMEINLTNISFVEELSDKNTFSNETVNNKSVNLNISTIEINNSGDITNVNEHTFDLEKSVNMSATTIPKYDEDKSVSKEVNLTNISGVDELSDCNTFSNESANNKSVHLNISSIENNSSGDISNVTEHKFDLEKSATTVQKYDEDKSVPMEINLTNISVVEALSNNNTFSNETENNKSVNLNISSIEINNTGDISNVTEHTFNLEKSVNMFSTTTVPKYDEDKSVSMEINLTNISVVGELSDKNKFSNETENNKSVNLNISFETINTGDISNATEHKFDLEKSVNILSATTVPKYDEDKSVSMEINLPNITVVEELLDNNTFSNESTNNKSVCFNKSSSEIINTGDNSNISEHKFDLEKSMNILSATTVPKNNEEKSVPMEISFINNSVVKELLDNNTYSNELTNNKSVCFDKSSSEIINTGDISNISEHKFDLEKSMNILSATTVPKNNEEKSVPMEISFINNSVVKELLDNNTYSNELTNNKSVCFDKSSSEIINTGDISNVSEHKFDLEKSVNISSATTVLENDEDKTIPMEINLTNITIVEELSHKNTFSNETANNKSVNLNIATIGTNNSGDITNVTEHKFDLEKSVNMSATTVPKYDEDKSVSKEVNLTNISGVDELSDCNTFSNESANNKSVNLNISSIETNSTGDVSNVTEHKFDWEKSATIVPKYNKDKSVHMEINLTNISVVEELSDKNIFSNETENNKSVNLNISSIETNNTGDISNVTEHTFNLEKSATIVPKYDVDKSVSMEINLTNINVVEVLSDKNNVVEEFTDKNTSSNESENSKCMHYNETNQTNNFSNTTVLTSNDTFYDQSQAIRQYLNFEQTVYELCNNVASDNSSNTTLIGSKNNDDSVQVDESFDNSIATNLSVIIENRTLEDIANIQDFENVNMHSLVSENIIAKDSSRLEMVKNENISLVKNNDLMNNINLDKKIGETNISTNCSMLIDDLSNALVKGKNQLDNGTTGQILIPEEIAHQSSINTNRYMLLTNDFQQDLLDMSTTENISKTLEEYNNIEKMLDFKEDKKVQMFEHKTPKTEKLLDLSIIQQATTFNSQLKNQKLLNFSIINQSPVSICTKQTSLNDNCIKKDALIDFSSVGQPFELEVLSANEVSSKENDFSSNNLSTISAPDIDIMGDESIKINSPTHSNSTYNDTITETNINLSTYCDINKPNNISQNNIEPLDKYNSSVLINKTNDFSELNGITELEQNKSSKEHNMENAITEEDKFALNCSSNITFNQNFKNNNSTDLINPNQELTLNSNGQAIVDFSIIEQPSELKCKDNVSSDCNISNLIEMSVVSTANTKSNEQVYVSSEKLMNSNLEESTCSNNTEILTDVQMNDISLLMESPEKSSINESFHSIELDQAQDDNKRKLESFHEYHNEKKMKVEIEEPRTPISMLYKIKNMFRSSEKKPQANNTKENYLKSNKCNQSINYNKIEENNDWFIKPTSSKKPELLTKSKIPCKVTDKSFSKTDEHNSSSFLNGSIKTNKSIPKLIGGPVLSDLSNSSNKKCPESRIPSKFKK